MSEHSQSRESVLTSGAEDGAALEWASDDLKGDREIIKMAVSQNWQALRWASDLVHRNRSDFCDLRLRCPSRTPEIAPISETRESNAALRFKGAMESR